MMARDIFYFISDNLLKNDVTINKSTDIINNLYSFKNIINNNYPVTYNFCEIFLYLALIDFLLIIVFGSKSRWFQLHAFTNFIVAKKCFPIVIDILKNPEIGYIRKDLDVTTLYVICLHIYHLIMFKRKTVYDYFHHLLFIGFGVLPSFYVIKSNQNALSYIVCNGIPGIIEYTSLSLVKHEKITVYRHKFNNTLNYLLLRMPACYLFTIYNMYNYYYGILNDSRFGTYYFNFLFFSNGIIFTYLTVENYVNFDENKNIKSE